MLIERMLFNVIAFLLFILVFFKMVKKNDSNIIAILVIQALGIAFSFLELMAGKTEWTTLKIISYILSVFLPVIYLQLDNKNINLIERFNVLMAKIYMITNQKAKARKKLIYISTKYPESYMAHKWLAKMYESEGGMRKAIDEYIKAVDIKSTDYDAYYKIAELLNHLTRKDEAITMLESLLKNKPDYTKASELLGDLLIEKERYKEAANVYIEGLKYAPDNYDIYYNLGIAYTMLNDFQNAKLAYESASEINHLKYKSLYALGKISLIYNDVSSAEKYFTQAIYGEETEAMAYYELAKVYMIKGQKEKVIVFLEKAIELDSIYAKKMDNEIIFIPIKAYIRKNTNASQKVQNKLSKKEVNANKHLENTYNIVEKLSDVDQRLKSFEESKRYSDKQRNDYEKGM